jgi:hypothetical protein
MSSPYPSLLTADLPSPAIWDIKPDPKLQEALETRFKPLQTTYPGMINFSKTKKYSPYLRFDHMWHLDSFSDGVPQKSGPFSGKARLFKDGKGLDEIKDISGYCKITHLLDAYRMIQGNYPMAQHPALPAPGKKSAKVYSKIHDPHNQAYVDAVACYMLSKFREADHSPHFSLFYGSYLAIAKEYYYNITEDFPDMRFEGWFWRKRAQGIFKLLGFQRNHPLKDDDPLLEQPDDLSDSESDDSGSESIKDLNTDKVSVDEESLHSASISTMSTEESESGSGSGSDESYESRDSIGKDITLFAALSDFPTMLIFLEANKNTMDSLLEDDSTDLDARIGTPEWEACWSAWIFQVVAALCQVQSLWAMTHNDLHSNNILWTPTDKPFLYYKTRDGRQWKVPTYGKIFRIIDFGRAIYTHNGTLSISDDYWPDNDAGSQYNFGPLYDPSEPRVYPNPSFDLCRLSVSIMEALFLEIPADKEGGAILSSELDRVQHETTSDLFNVLWGWLIDDDGRNVLWDADQSERYPGFDLYQIISKKVKGAVPREQIDKAPFVGFVLPSGETVSDGEKVYSLFC